MIVHPRYLLPEQVRKIKALLWAGHMSQPEIAALYSTHQAGISRILNGHIWEEIEWPDGSGGRMNPNRYKVITSSRKRSARYGKKQEEGKPSEETSKALNRINEIIHTHPDTREASSLRITLGYNDANRNRERSEAWRRISENDPYHPIVRELKSGRQNSALMTAMCLILVEIPIQDWARKKVIEAIYKLSHWLENNP